MDWIDDSSVVIGGVDQELAGVVAVVDAVTGEAVVVARGFEIGPLFPVAGHRGQAYWAPLDGASVWTGSESIGANQVFEVPLAVVQDLEVTDRGVLVGGFAPDQVSAVAEWFAFDGRTLGVDLEAREKGSIQVAASPDGATSFVVTVGLPESPGGAFQTVTLVTGAGSRNIELGDLIEDVSLAGEGSQVLYRSRADGRLVEMDLGNGALVVLADDADVGSRSSNGSLAYAKPDDEVRASRLCVVPAT